MALPQWLARANRRLTNPIFRQFAGFLPPFAMLEHRGRKSGKAYRIPIIVFPDGNEFVIVLTYGAETDWVKNVTAAGGCTVEYRRRTIHLVRPRIVTDTEKRYAPLPFRLLLARIGPKECMRFDVAS